MLLLIRIIFIHLDRIPSLEHQLHILRIVSNDRLNIFLPLRPVAIHKVGHVLRLLVWVLQVHIGRFLCTLVGVPVIRYSPRFRGRLIVGCSKNFEGHIDAVTLAALKEAIMLQVDLEHVLDLEDLTHPRWTQINLFWAHVVPVLIAIRSVHLASRSSMVSPNDCS